MTVLRDCRFSANRGIGRRLRGYPPVNGHDIVGTATTIPTIADVDVPLEEAGAFPGG